MNSNQSRALLEMRAQLPPALSDSMPDENLFAMVSPLVEFQKRCLRIAWNDFVQALSVWWRGVINP